MTNETDKPRIPLLSEIPFEPESRGKYVILTKDVMRVTSSTEGCTIMRWTYSSFFEKIIATYEDTKWAIQDWWRDLR
jgi:hypothetical protein